MIRGTHLLAGPSLLLTVALAACQARAPQRSDTSGAALRRDAAAPPDARSDARTDTIPRPDAASERAADAAPECVPDIGGGKSGTRTVITPDGVLKVIHHVPSCWLEAACIHEQGRTFPGDAEVWIDCLGKHCTCTFQAYTPKKRRFKFSFDVDDPCDDKRLTNLLLDRCATEGRRQATARRR